MTPTPTPERKPDIHREYRGEKVCLMNINWTKNLDKAWQCNWQKTYSRCESTYGSSPDEAFDSMKTLIDLFLLKEPEIIPDPTPESRLRKEFDDFVSELPSFVGQTPKDVIADFFIGKLSSECERAREEAKAEVREVLRSHFRPRTDKHYGATTDNKRKAKNTVIKEIATELKIDLNIEDLTSLTHTKL